MTITKEQIFKLYDEWATSGVMESNYSYIAQRAYDLGRQQSILQIAAEHVKGTGRSYTTDGLTIVDSDHYAKSLIDARRLDKAERDAELLTVGMEPVEYTIGESVPLFTADQLAAARLQGAEEERQRQMQKWSRFHHAMHKHGLHPGRTDDDLIDILDSHLGRQCERVNQGLLDALRYALDWVDAVPNVTPLPAMPGFDRDWVDLFDSVICVLTLGKYNPCFAMNFAAWFAIREIKIKRNHES